MELIYMYLGNIKRPLANQGIHFGSKFHVDYNPESRELTITKRLDSSPCIYGECIESFDLLVGRNGTGKSTILELLGLPYRSRLEMLPITKGDVNSSEHAERHTWFALYHVQDDLFAVEGYWADMLNVLKANNMFWKPFYSAAFRYDLENQRALSDFMYLQHYTDSTDLQRSISERLFYVLYEPESGAAWYSKPYDTPQSDTSGDFSCQRIYAGHSGYEAITHYLYDSVHSHEFASKMASKPGTEITIKLHQQDKSDFAQFAGDDIDKVFDRSSAGEKIAARLIYGDQLSLVDSAAFQFSEVFSSEEKEPFSYKERMVLMYLEELACYTIMQQRTWPRPHPIENSYPQRKKYLLHFLENFDKAEFALAEEILTGLEAIPDRYFVNGSKAVIPLHDMEGNFLIWLTHGLDSNTLMEHEINHRYFIRLTFVGISTGEAQYLDLYAALYHAITTYQHRKGDTCVLLLDEPDCRFHPEWSRNFVLNLTELLHTDVFRDYHYQVIISTHSPLLVSDVPKESIHCMYRNPDGSISIKPSEYGLMINLNNLITDSFFADSIFGAYAEQYANQLIVDIRAATFQQEPVTKAQLDGLRVRLERIEDRTIRESLDHQLRRLEARNR